MCAVRKSDTAVFKIIVITMAQHTNVKSNYGTPIAVVIAGLLISGAVLWSNGNASGTSRQQSGAQQALVHEPSGDFRLPNESDHVRGNRDAKIAIIEFSDFECPFCARLHPTLTRIVEENKDVKWVYRHFPLSSIHSRALSAAAASECIAKLGSNDAFWNFADTAFADQRKLGSNLYEELARSAGIDSSAFNACTKDKSIASEVRADLDEVTNIGGRGTPFAVVVAASGKLSTFSGALPYEQVSAVIEQARNN